MKVYPSAPPPFPRPKLILFFLIQDFSILIFFFNLTQMFNPGAVPQDKRTKDTFVCTTIGY